MNYYCFDIHHNLSINYNNQTVEVGPCCQAQHYRCSQDHGYQGLVNHDNLIALRIANQQNQSLPRGCDPCVKAEKAGGLSRRLNQQQFYRSWTGEGIRSLDIHLGNLCNMACVICSPENSTSWIPDARRLGIEIKPEWNYSKKTQYDFSWAADITALEQVHFWGGEPLINATHMEFLKKLQHRDVLKNCRISYNTNGMFTVDAKCVDLWKQSKLVELYFSIDDMSERFNYQRHRGDWQKLVKHLRWYQDLPISNHLFYVTISWGILNIYYLPELLIWLKENFSHNRYGDPTQIFFNKVNGDYSLDTVNPKMFDRLKTKFEPHPELLPLLNALVIDHKFDAGSFWSKINHLDHIRGTSFVSTHPEWSEILH